MISQEAELSRAIWFEVVARLFDTDQEPKVQLSRFNTEAAGSCLTDLSYEAAALLRSSHFWEGQAGQAPGVPSATNARRGPWQSAEKLVLVTERCRDCTPGSLRSSASLLKARRLTRRMAGDELDRYS